MDDSEGLNDLDLYHRHVKPLEAEHWGEYAAVHPKGETMVGKDRKALRKQADSLIGEDSIIFRIGPMVSRGFRWLRAVPDPPGTAVHPEEDSYNLDCIREVAEHRAGIYEQYGKPLEPVHWGKYLAVHPDGATILEEDYDTLAARARNELGKGSIIFRVGGKNDGTTLKPLELILRYYD